MQVAFPYPVELRSQLPTWVGLRHQPFTNIDSETFGRPTLNGFWKVEMGVVARGMQAHLALSSFVTQMSAGGTVCALPICTTWRPRDAQGRSLVGRGFASPYVTDHTGFGSDPFDGFRLLAQARHRDSYIDVIRPGLSQLLPGHFITLGERLHQVVKVTHINEQPNRIRVSVMPNIRGGYPTNTTVVVDHLQLRAQMEDADDVEHWQVPHSKAKAVFLEAF